MSRLPAPPPINLLPIRQRVAEFTAPHRYGPSDEDLHDFAYYAAAALPQLCDEVVRLRAIVADRQVTPA